jgi:CRISPR/Cas system-associated exonuclease Cas4 (RecB family)
VTVLRPSPYIHVSWIKKLLIGDNSCEWAAWYKAHYQNWPKMPSDFNLPKWKAEHAAFVQEIRRDLQAGGKTVRIEAQNFFRLPGRNNVILAGTPDLITASDGKGIIYDAKTGKPNDGDKAQVMIYMWAVPRALPQYKGVKFDGVIKYHSDEVRIPHSALDGSFITRLVELIRRVAADSPPTPAPSGHECGFCEITRDDCAERFDEEAAMEIPNIDIAF